MAALTTQQRQDVRALIGSLLSSRRESFNLTKAVLDTAVAATDQWIEDNQASYLAALSTAYKNGTTTKQKLEIFKLVAQARYDVG